MRSGSSSAAPRRKQTAPTKVPRLTSSTFRGSPLSGITYEATADTPNATEPIRFKNAIQPDSPRTRRNSPCATSAHASPLATRKQTDPRASGRQIHRFGLRGVERGEEREARADVEVQRADQLHDRRPPVDAMGLPERTTRRRSGRRRRCPASARPRRTAAGPASREEERSDEVRQIVRVGPDGVEVARERHRARSTSTRS